MRAHPNMVEVRYLFFEAAKREMPKRNLLFNHIGPSVSFIAEPVVSENSRHSAKHS